jgi:hypothetical protein
VDTRTSATERQRRKRAVASENARETGKTNGQSGEFILTEPRRESKQHEDEPELLESERDENRAENSTRMRELRSHTSNGPVRENNSTRRQKRGLNY